MKIAIIGCGNMGLTYARSFTQYGLCTKDELTLVEKSEARSQELQAEQLGQIVADIDAGVSASEVVVLAVKPQDFGKLAKDLSPHLSENHIVLSIMAGIRIVDMEAQLKHSRIVRAMPNLPARIGMGMTAFTAKEGMERKYLRTAESLLDTTGRALFLEDENLLDAVTALSGSGPAYFFLFVDQMVKAGKSMGLDEATARVLAKQTMLGSYHLLNNTTKSLEELIASVSSKGGTTEAAFEVFKAGKLGETLQAGVLRAEERARELSEE